MYKYNEINAVHLEVTDKCNASCSQCLRNNDGTGVNKNLKITELRIDDVKKIFKEDFIRNLKRMYMCGNYGDPIVAKDTLEIYKYFRDNNESMKLSMNTNGSFRGADWWKELAIVFNDLGEVKFGLDGLEDTHKIYRQGTDFNKIIENAKAFISKGGNAVWEFIIFAHNEHQVEEARRMSEGLGFKRFVTKKTWRFFSNSKNKKKERHIAKTKEGKELILEKAKDKKYENIALKKEEEIKKKHGSLKEYFSKTSVNCKVKEEKSVYVSAEGLILPCCWLANQLYIAYLPYKGAPIWKLIDSNGGIDKINALKFNLKEIIEGDFFQKVIPDSWENKERLDVCGKICGSEFDPFTSQYK